MSMRKHLKRLVNDFNKYIATEPATLANKLGTETQTNRKKNPSEAFKQYWQRSVHLLFLDVAFGDMKPHFSQEKKIIKRSLKDQSCH